MITIENINSKTTERTKEQLRNKHNPEPSVDKDDRKEILDHIHDVVDFGCNESIYPGPDRRNMLNNIRNILESGVSSNDIEVIISVNDKTNTNKYFRKNTNLNGLLEILGL